MLNAEEDTRLYELKNKSKLNVIYVSDAQDGSVDDLEINEPNPPKMYLMQQLRET